MDQLMQQRDGSVIRTLREAGIAPADRILGATLEVRRGANPAFLAGLELSTHAGNRLVSAVTCVDGGKSW
jgi:hypothetical protein